MEIDVCKNKPPDPLICLFCDDSFWFYFRFSGILLFSEINPLSPRYFWTTSFSIWQIFSLFPFSRYVYGMCLVCGYELSAVRQGINGTLCVSPSFSELFYRPLLGSSLGQTPTLRSWDCSAWSLITVRLRVKHLLSFPVLIQGTQFTQQSYKVSDAFPFKWINKKWREGFHVNSMATAGPRWGVVMSRNTGFSDQVVGLDFLYPSEGIHNRWDGGYRITSTSATLDLAALILSVPKRRLGDETQDTLRTSQIPSTHVRILVFGEDLWSAAKGINGKHCYCSSYCLMFAYRSYVGSSFARAPSRPSRDCSAWSLGTVRRRVKHFSIIPVSAQDSPVKLNSFEFWTSRCMVVSISLSCRLFHGHGCYILFLILGHGRSVAVMSAMLVALGVVDNWKDAEKLIKSKRPYIRMNTLHRQALEEWGKHRLSPLKRQIEANVSSVILADSSMRK